METKTKLSGFIKLSQIPKGLVRKMEGGDMMVYVDVVKRQEPSAKGYTHYVSIWDAEKKEKIYIGNLKAVAFGSEGVEEDLPDFLR